MVGPRKSLGGSAADAIVGILGSWPFVICQSVFFAVWMTGNAVGWFHFDPPPWLRMNIIMSVEAAYATSLVLISDRRSSERAREQMRLLTKMMESNLDQTHAMILVLEELERKRT